MKSLSAKSVSSILSLVLGAAVCCCCAQDQDLFSNALGWDVADKFLVSRGGGNNNVVFAPTRFEFLSSAKPLVLERPELLLRYWNRFELSILE